MKKFKQFLLLFVYYTTVVLINAVIAVTIALFGVTMTDTALSLLNILSVSNRIIFAVLFTVLFAAFNFFSLKKKSRPIWTA